MSLADEECQPSIPASLLYPTSAYGGDKNLIFSINNVDGRRTIEERRYSTSNASIGGPTRLTSGDHSGGEIFAARHHAFSSQDHEDRGLPTTPWSTAFNSSWEECRLSSLEQVARSLGNPRC